MTLRVWITRSEPGCSRLAGVLKAAGYDVLAAPVLTVEPTGARLPAGSFQHVFFLSEQAVRLGGVGSGDEGGIAAYARGARIHAVGRQTAARLAEFGVSSRVPQQATSEGLIAELEPLALAGAACLIVAGEGGRKTLAGYLKSRSAQVSEYLCYRRVTMDVAAERLAGVTHILVASQDGFRAMARLWCSNGGDPDVRVIAASDRIAALGAELGLTNLAVAAGAADADFIAALEAQ